MLAAHPVDANGQAPSAFNTLVPRELDAATLRATAERPDYRYQSLVTMAAELRSISAILEVLVIAAPFYMQLTVDEVIARGDVDLMLALALGFALALLVLKLKLKLPHLRVRLRLCLGQLRLSLALHLL